ncbi:MAG: hypothetical protein LBQ46_13550 [Treponema sp.]|jgi:hypothetical protein|nr:hypothetical protein [Treponema sp.]
MRNVGPLLFGFVLFGALVPLGAQSHVSVPVDHEIYYVLEMAQIRGLCDPLPAVRPYSQKQVLDAIDMILSRDTGILSGTERDIIQKAYRTYQKHETGLDWRRGNYTFQLYTPKKKIPFGGDIGIGTQISFSGAYYTGIDDFEWGADNKISAYTNGDVGDHFSYRFHFLGHITRAPRGLLGEDYHTYYDGFTDEPDEGYIDQTIRTYSQPLAFFPYTYRKTWDGFVVFPGDISATGLRNWPDEMAIAPMILSELSGTLLGEVLTWRFGRLRREWGAMSVGRSLIFNEAAQPFVALEATFSPFSWLSFSALTGVLEYFNDEDLKSSAWTFQNAFSIEMLEINFKNNFHFDIGSTAVWAKRFELGYIFPLKNNFLYQDSIGDFDNMGLFVNLRGKLPGEGKILWFSFFADEIDPDINQISQFFQLDRKMYAFQGGVRAVIPQLPFSSISLSYTKIEPYTYTHNRIFVPWYNNEYDGKTMPMETAYLNNGESLGYYLPPNSDELLLRFQTMPWVNTLSFFQYQMIRHGADHGPQAVDGSSFASELDPRGRNSKDVLKKFFLKDGAYEWQHIIMVGAEHTLERFSVPIKVFGSFGVVVSYYTGIDGPANSGKAFSYSVIDTPSYPKSTGIILTLGFRIYM